MIGLDATFVRAGRLTGIERHILEMVANLVRAAPAGTFVVACRKEAAEWFASVRDRAEIRVCPWQSRPLVDQLWLPAQIARTGVELVHYMTLAPPLLQFKPFLITIHDLTYWKLRSAVSTGGRIYYRPLLERAMRSALLRGVITVSASAQREIQDFLGDAARVWVVPNAPAPHFRPVGRVERERVRRLYGLEQPYVLTVGTIEPRKNLPGLLRAFAAVRRRSAEDLKLVVVGRRGWERNLRIPREVESHVRFLGMVPDGDLPALYSGAALFASSSLYEGFGLPLIEAMACGATCVVSDLSVFREVGGDACLYADPTDAEAFAEAMLRGLALARSDQTQARSLQQAARFSWEASARRLLQIYQELLSGL